MDETLCNGIMRPCCADESKREEVAREQIGELVNVTERCRDCGRKHYTSLVPPVRFGIKGANA